MRSTQRGPSVERGRGRAAAAARRVGQVVTGDHRRPALKYREADGETTPRREGSGVRPTLPRLAQGSRPSKRRSRSKDVTVD